MNPTEAQNLLKTEIQPKLTEAMGFVFDLKRASYDQTGIYSLMSMVAEVRAVLNRMEQIVKDIKFGVVQIDNALMVTTAAAREAMDQRLTSMTASERTSSWEVQNASARLAATDLLIEQRKMEQAAAVAHAALDIVQSKSRSLAAVRNDIQQMLDIFKIAALPREVT